MYENESGTFYKQQSIYTPTPEAMALDWDSLCPSTRKALEKIIFWLDAACNANKSLTNESDKLASKYEAPSTSILLSGDRGSGKTTVLLSAAYMYSLAMKQRNNFFTTIDHRIREQLENSYEKVTWLNTLDLEPLHPQSNLLATMLVRIREVILNLDYDDDEGCSERRNRHASILEGDLGTAENLNRLINEATYMWEGLPGGISRSERSMEQIKAAEIYAEFQNKFKNTMEKTITLVNNRRKQTELFVLPIDNVDRSIEHISNISKLIRLAASNRLWFILAAVRPDYQLFLERSFQNELLRSTMGSNEATWDQTQAIARRQAATAMRRTLPDKYQIRIESLEPKYCWDFSNGREILECGDKQYLENKQILENYLKQTSCVDLVSSLNKITSQCKPMDKKLTLGDQLRGDKFNIPYDETGKFKTLADLFTITEKFLNAMGLLLNKDNQILIDSNAEITEDWVKKILKPFEFELYDHESFLVSADKADLKTAWVGENIQLKAIGKLNYKDHIFTGAGRMALGLSMRTLLDLKEAISYEDKDEECAVEVSIKMLRNAIDESNIQFWASDQLLNRIIRKNSNGKWILDLTGNPIRGFKQTLQFNQIYFPQKLTKDDPFVIEESLKWQNFPDIVLEMHNLGNDEVSIPLPSVIAGWFMILYDLLVPRSKNRVISEPILPNEVFSWVVQNSHKLIWANKSKPVELIFDWETPEWKTFVQHFLFAAQWTEILKILDDLIAKKVEEAKGLKDEHKIGINRIVRLAWIDNICSVFGKDDNSLVITAYLKDLLNIDAYAKKVNIKLRKLALSLKSSRKTVLSDWLLKKLPLFLGPEYSLLTKCKGKLPYQKDSLWSKDETEKDLKENWEKYEAGLIASREKIVRLEITKSLGLQMKADNTRKIQKIMDTWFKNVDNEDGLFWDQCREDT